jgi:hypothetical protein
MTAFSLMLIIALNLLVSFYSVNFLLHCLLLAQGVYKVSFKEISPLLAFDNSLMKSSLGFGSSTKSSEA